MSVDIPPCYCPYCDTLLEQATVQGDIASTEVPEPGNLLLCFHCAQVLFYDDNLTPRKPHPGEFEAAIADPEIARQVALGQIAIRQSDRRNLGQRKRPENDPEG